MSSQFMVALTPEDAADLVRMYDRMATSGDKVIVDESHSHAIPIRHEYHRPGEDKAINTIRFFLKELCNIDIPKPSCM